MSYCLPYTCIIVSLTTFQSINCRLPQTPRSPYTAASHYFDDIFSRSARPHGRGQEAPRIRRSSSSRSQSVSGRSDIGLGTTTPGAEAALDEEWLDDRRIRGDIAERHFHDYVEGQVQRVRSNSVASFEDELESEA